MNLKMKFKIVTDILMTLSLLFLMGYHLWGEAAHEWVGAGLLILFVLHNLLNQNWYKGLGKGKYSAMRVVQTILNFLLLVCMAILMYSGIVLSNYLLPGLAVPGRMSLARLLHMSTAYWGLVLMALHLGLHWNMLLGMMKRGMKKSDLSEKTQSFVGLLIGTIIAVYGLSVFVRRDLLTYMLVRTEFVFLDYGESKFLFYVDYLALMGLFIYIAHYGAKLLRRIQNKGGIKK